MNSSTRPAPWNSLTVCIKPCDQSETEFGPATLAAEDAPETVYSPKRSQLLENRSLLNTSKVRFTSRR